MKRRPLKTVSDTRLVGNFGEAHVSALLSAGGCFVRPVADGTDIGVDLYCETNVPHDDGTEKTPFLHFWVQVKAGKKKCEIVENGARARFHFDLDALAYWYRQPIPVFAALVPTEWPPVASPDVYFIDVSSQLVVAGPPLAGQTLYSQLRINPYDQTALDILLHRLVPRATTILGCKNGVVGTLPMLHPHYTSVSPLMPAGNHSNTIIRQLRRTAANSIISMWRHKQLFEPAMVVNRQLMARVASAFAEHDQSPHWESQFAVALSRHADGAFAEAIDLYKRAREIIKTDPNINSNDRAWLHHIAEIEDLLRHAEGLLHAAGPA